MHGLLFSPHPGMKGKAQEVLPEFGDGRQRRRGGAVRSRRKNDPGYSELCNTTSERWHESELLGVQEMRQADRWI